VIKRVLFQVHWFLGITAGLVLAVMGVTGASMSFQDEINEALSPRIYAPGAPKAPDLTPDQLIAALQTANPGYYVTRLDWESARERSHRVRMAPIEKGERKQGQVDRTSGAWLAQPPSLGFFHVMDELHRYLALPGGGGGIGRQITGFSALALIFFALSGLYLRWPRQALDWREWFVLDWRKTGRNLWRALHVTIGTWVLLFYLVSAFTGLWWSYNWYRQGVVYALTGKSGDEEGGSRAKKPADQPAPRPAFDPAWAAFQRETGGRYVWVRMTQPAPDRPVKSIQFDARPAEARHLRQTDKYSYDPKTYKLKKRDLYEGRPLGLVITQSVYEIHRGAFFGLPGRLIMLLTSVTMPLFTITGYLLYLSRRRRKQEARGLGVAIAHDRPADLLIVYASQTGTAEIEARNAVTAFVHGGLHAELLPIAKLTAERFAEARKILFVVSTYGEGAPPDTAHGFYNRAMRGPLPDLSHLHYGVLALGDREYEEFCGFGVDLDAWLSRAGAQPLFEIIKMEHHDEAAHQAWHEALQHLGAGQGTRGQQHIPFEHWTLVARKELNPGSSHLKAYHLRLEPPADSEMPWEAGDIVEVQPCNAPEAIDALLAAHAPDGELLEASAQQRERLAGVMLPRPGSGPIDAAAVAQWRPLPIREYSAASIAADGTLDLVVRQVRGETGGFGIGSGWLTAHLPMGSTTMLRVRPNPGFRLEPDGRPLILIGNGTGIAGLRAHLRAQAHAGIKGHWLLFGERSRAHEAFFEEELLGWQRDGTLARLDRAFSRDADCGLYVQHLLLDAGAEVKSWIDRGAVILVCGSLAGMASEVHDALTSLIGTARLDQLAEEGRYMRDVY